MLLYLMRHGIAEPATLGQEDRTRRLTPEGEAQVRRLALLLRRAGLGIRRVLSSPYLRAQQTAELVAGLLEVPCTTDGLLQPGCSLQDVEELLGRFSESGDVMLVGHQPDLGKIVQLLTFGMVAMRPGTVAVIETSTLRAYRGILRGLYDPDVMAA